MHRGEQEAYVLLDVISIFLLEPCASNVIAKQELSQGLMHVISDANNAARLVLDRVIAKERASSIRKYRNVPTPRWRHTNGATLLPMNRIRKNADSSRLNPRVNMVNRRESDHHSVVHLLSTRRQNSLINFI